MLRPLMAVVVALGTTTTHAEILYDFVQAGTGDTLARWRLAELPATQEDSLSIDFTAAGEAMFGLGPTYPEPLTHSVADIVRDDGAGGLGPQTDAMFGLPSLADFDAPASTLVDAPAGARFYAGYRLAPGMDELLYTWQDSACGPGSLSVLGDWVRVPVPEPASVSLAGVALILASPRRRRWAVE